ncbi:hypothetical protein B0T19DRAFT_52101 [Cercophora scortea]|uniref:ML-like domain-containing protein n=1 Tax=Cercophora scortea TaxID=314031 RepID=A0AAE0J5A9_9PEZI|nr:hypothetical protein B0T19DRAFT_52101 [Cercophora scortea]
MAPRDQACALLLALFSILSVFVGVQADDNKYTYGTDGAGVTRQLAVNRYPALYTGDFGDCLGGQSLFNITKFDAAYYADNLTIVFHLDGASNIKNESLMMHISVEAYGSSRFDMTFDPCYLNIYSLCPLNASVPITGWARIPVGPQQIGGIPPIAFDIPDFEGSTKLQIFANSSKTEIGCFQAVMRNGNTFSHPEAVGPVLGIFTLVAIIASFATAAYGVSIVHMRMHYAHSLSVFVVFETFQAIFFSGALSVGWPSILVAWWSNFAWASGMIYSYDMVHSINSIAGVTGNASQVGGAGSVVLNNGGGLISQIYGRSLVKQAAAAVTRRSVYNASDPYDYTWSGNPVTPGMPTPGTWPGLPGALSSVGIPAADAFLVGLIWLLVAIGLVTSFITSVKVVLEGMARIKWVREDRLGYFRSHWIRYLILALLRTFFISFFMTMTLTMFQFTVQGPTGPTAIAAVVFALSFVGVIGLVAYACRTRTRHGKFRLGPDKVVFHRAKLARFIPGMVPIWASTLNEHELKVEPIFTIPLFCLRHVNNDPACVSVHQDESYIKRFGWLSARYRRTRWWFFAYYVGYLFIRAAFLGGGARNPLAQVYGLLIFEIISFGIIIILNPFEGARNTALAVWMLSISKIATTGLSIAFLPEFGLDRIIATVIGVVIIVIQGLMVVGLLILILLSAISSWMSLTRNREEFKPEFLESTRVRYFEKMETKALDTFMPPKPKEDKKGKGKEAEVPEPPPQPSFAVVSVRRAPKIEDEDGDVLHELESAKNGSPARGTTRARRTNSVGSVRSLPRSIHARRSSWSSREFAQWEGELPADPPESSFASRLSSNNGAASGSRRGENDSIDSIISSPSVRPASPFSSGRLTPTRDVLARHAEERRYHTPTPKSIPEIE